MRSLSFVIMLCSLFSVFGCSEKGPTVPQDGKPAPGWTYDNGAAVYAEETTDGGYVIFGNSGWETIDSKFSDILLIKTDGSGNVQWRK